MNLLELLFSLLLITTVLTGYSGIMVHGQAEIETWGRTIYEDKNTLDIWLNTQ
jgi:hypothetical protein